MTVVAMEFNTDLVQVENLFDESIEELSKLDPRRISEQLPEISLPLRSLAPAFYLRQAGTDPAHVRLLADAASSTDLPPILVQKNSLRIIDGMHRVQVAKLRGEHSISARVVDCTEQEALVLAVKSNTLHGLPLTRADRVSSAKRILSGHPDWSDRAVASITGLSAKSVASLRNSATGDSPVNVKRLGRDGKRRPVVAGEGRRRAAEYIKAHPDASLREVARETEVSLGTVHDVRAKLRDGAPHENTTPSRPSAPVAGNRLSDRPVHPVPTTPGLPMRGAGAGVNVRQLAWPAISAKLTGDPALRYTDGGRAFLRWMAMHAMQADEWWEFIDAVPQRWLKDVAQVAVSMSEEWQEFARQLQQRQVAAG
jgi:hypothetical protein